MHLLDKGSEEIAVVTSVYVEKTYLGKCKCEFCGILINTGQVDLSKFRTFVNCQGVP